MLQIHSIISITFYSNEETNTPFKVYKNIIILHNSDIYNIQARMQNKSDYCEKHRWQLWLKMNMR